MLCVKIKINKNKAEDTRIVHEQQPNTEQNQFNMSIDGILSILRKGSPCTHT